MPSIGNKATLVNSEICQKCAKCCKEFVMSCDTNCALRFVWIEKEKIPFIKVEDTPFQLPYGGGLERRAIFKLPCFQLEEGEDGSFRCKVWNEKRPDFCNTYPDHIFYDTDLWDTVKIKKLLQQEREFCPFLKEVSIKQVQEMLKKYRGERVKIKTNRSEGRVKNGRVV